MIYKITNNLNNKIYIGGTVKTSLKKRFGEHFAHARKYGSKTQKSEDMRNISKENWSIEKIEDCENDQIKFREIYYIKKYREEGYELYNEDNNSNARTTFYSCDILTGEITEYKSLKETKLNFSKISGVLNGLEEKRKNGKHYYRFSHDGKLWSYENNLENWKKLFFLERNKIAKKKKIICIEKGIVYSSIAEANIDLGLKIKNTAITSCLNYNKMNPDKKQRKAHGYHWEIIEEDLPEWVL